MDKTTTNRNVEALPYEFTLYVNNNIVCQRYFDINYFNEDCLNSLELKEMIDNITGMNYDGLGIIPSYLKEKSVNHLWENYNPYSTDESYKSVNKKRDQFRFEFKVDKRVVIESTFPNEFFSFSPYLSADIREVIPEIISEIRFSTSQKKYTKV
jgi:hypothetical protein